jgi:phospholipid-binding lipoprotein MlaA
LALLAPLLALAACAHSPADDPRDPLEPVNRAVYAFNDKADTYVLRPVAKGYVYITPDIFRRGVSNFFDNLFYPKTIINDLLQAKFLQSASDTGRLLLNTTAGLGGILDVASEVGLTKHNEDFGQTLGYWGVGEGWFLMLPFLGPSDNRDLIGTGVDQFANISYYLPGRYDVYKFSANGLNLINERAEFLSSDAIIKQQFDPYIFIRTAYLQRRQSLVYDGNPPPDPMPTFDDPAPTDAPKKK